MAGTQGRVYGGDPNLVHIADGQRRAMGELMATLLDARMRGEDAREGIREWRALCAGCYQVAAFNMLVTLAQRNGQSLTELGRTMAAAFARLEADGDKATSASGLEEIACLIDPPDLMARIDAQDAAFTAFADSGALDGLQVSPPLYDEHVSDNGGAV